MDIVMLPQIGAAGSAGGGARYRLMEREVSEDGTLQLTDRCVTCAETDGSVPVRAVFPPREEGFARDFFLRLVVATDTVPETSFVPYGEESFSFENADADTFACTPGVNVFSFTEVADGVWFANRKSVDAEIRVAFDPLGGTLAAEAVRSYRLGAKYGNLPFASRGSYSLEGWYTAPLGGVEVKATDPVKAGVGRLYARWGGFVDPYVAAVCAAGNLSFESYGSAPWTVDAGTCRSAGGSARSGAVGHAMKSVLSAAVTGPGTLEFWWKTSSEANFDKLSFVLDGVSKHVASGDTGWQRRTVAVSGEGRHVLEWEYSKDVSDSDGSDCGWVDDVVWTPQEA